jgi:hypothetical protein
MKMRSLLGTATMVVTISLALAARSAHGQSLTGFHYAFKSSATQIEIQQQIVGPDIVGPDIVGPDRAQTVATIISGNHSLRVTMSTTSTFGAETAQGEALAAILGLMQGLAPADIVKIVGPDMSIVGPDLQLKGGAFDSPHLLGVAAQLETAVAQLAIDTPPSHANLTYLAYQSASKSLGVAISCVH